MPKLTDEEVGQLLRETFTGKENLIDELPAATTRPVRRKAPVLLAAAAVLVVLAGIAVAVDLRGGPQSPPLAGKPGRHEAASNAGGDPATPTPAVQSMSGQSGPVLKAKIAGVAVAELAKWERPAGGWPVVMVLDAPYPNAGTPTGRDSAGTPFSEAEQAIIAKTAGIELQWVKSRPGGPDVCDQAASGTPYITVGAVALDKSGTTATLGMSMWRGCLDAQWLTYRLERKPTAVAESSSSDWHVTGTVGPVAQS